MLHDSEGGLFGSYEGEEESMAAGCRRLTDNLCVRVVIPNSFFSNETARVVWFVFRTCPTCLPSPALSSTHLESSFRRVQKYKPPIVFDFTWPSLYSLVNIKVFHMIYRAQF